MSGISSKKARILSILSLIVVLSSFSACNEKNTESAETESTLSVPATTIDENVKNTTTTLSTTTSEKNTSSAPDITTAVVSKGANSEKAEKKIFDTSIFADYPGMADVYTKIINEKKIYDKNKMIRKYTGDADIVDTGTDYLVGIDFIYYPLALNIDKYDNFIEKATKQISNKIDENGMNVFKYKVISGKNKLTLCGEELTLVSYSMDGNGRDECIFKDKNGKKLKLCNRLSPDYDDVTHQCYCAFKDNNGNTLYRKMKINGKSYLKIPHKILSKSESEIKRIIRNSPDVNVGNPAICFHIEFNKKGEINRISFP